MRHSHVALKPGFLLRGHSAALADEREERGAAARRAQVVGEFGLGEFVNRFRRGSLVMKLPDTEAARIGTVLFGTINGAIGVVASLPKDRFDFLWRLQARARARARAGAPGCRRGAGLPACCALGWQSGGAQHRVRCSEHNAGAWVTVRAACVSDAACPVLRRAHGGCEGAHWRSHKGRGGSRGWPASCGLAKLDSGCSIVFARAGRTAAW